MERYAVLIAVALASPALCHGGKPMHTDTYAMPEVALNRGWAEQAFSLSPAPPMPADRLSIVHEDEPGDTKVDTCSFASRPPIRLGEKTYAHGIGVNSHSVLRVSLTRPAEGFLADIGLDRNVDGTAASVRFHVSVGGADVFSTEVLRPGAPTQSIDVPLDGARELELTVDDGGDGRGWDQGDWADARVVLDDGTVLWLDDLARVADPFTGLPFSFVYDGRPSGELLSGWERSMTDEEIDTARRCRTLTLTDPQTGLQVRALCTIYTDTPGADWTVHFTNTGTADTPVIEQIQALDTTVRLGIDAQAALHRLRGSSCAVDDWLPFDDAIPVGKRVEFAPADGKSSLGASPFFSVSWGGGGVVTAVGWSGQWAASVENATDGLRLRAGIQKVHLRLRPGETIRGPRVLQLHWRRPDFSRATQASRTRLKPGLQPATEDPWRPYNLFRRTMLAHVVPKVDGKTVTPPIVQMSTSFYELNDGTEANVLSHLDAIKGLGFEFFWLDAYWTRGGFPAGMGNYGFPLSRVEPPDRFPNGLRPIGDAAHEEGMGFLVWFEPERVAAGTEIAREHPEWVISPDGSGGGLLNLGLPEARRYLTDYLITAIRRYRITCLRIDFNIGPLPYWRHLDQQDPDRVGMAEIRYVEGLYRMWDDILAACPDLFIDNCASGGMRIDLETCSRSLPLWRTDATIAPLFGHDFDQSALQNQVMTAGLSRYVPFSTSGQMGATPYQFRSGFNAGISFAEDCRPADYPREQLRDAIAEGKRLRKYYFGDLYVLSDVSTDPAAWCVLQYDRPEEQDGMVIAFRRHKSPYASYECDLHGIDPSAHYAVTVSADYTPPTPRRMDGDRLQRLTVDIADRPGSVVVEYRRGKTRDRR